MRRRGESSFCVFPAGHGWHICGQTEGKFICPAAIIHHPRGNRYYAFVFWSTFSALKYPFIAGFVDHPVTKSYIQLQFWFPACAMETTAAAPASCVQLATFVWDSPWFPHSHRLIHTFPRNPLSTVARVDPGFWSGDQTPNIPSPDQKAVDPPIPNSCHFSVHFALKSCTAAQLRRGQNLVKFGILCFGIPFSKLIAFNCTCREQVPKFQPGHPNVLFASDSIIWVLQKKENP